MSLIIDTYSTSNADGSVDLYAGAIIEEGQSVTGDGSALKSVQFYIRKTGSPTGNVVAKVYSHTGTFGTSSLPTGSALATSDNVDITTLAVGTPALKEFTFSGVNKITLVSGTKYVVTIYYSSGNSSNKLTVHSDGSSPTHGGNESRYVSSWKATSSRDLVFILYGDSSSVSSSVSSSQSISSSKSSSVSSSISASVSISSSVSSSPSIGVSVSSSISSSKSSSISSSVSVSSSVSSSISASVSSSASSSLSSSASSSLSSSVSSSPSLPSFVALQVDYWHIESGQIPSSSSSVSSSTSSSVSSSPSPPPLRHAIFNIEQTKPKLSVRAYGRRR